MNPTRDEGSRPPQVRFSGASRAVFRYQTLRAVPDRICSMGVRDPTPGGGGAGVAHDGELLSPCRPPAIDDQVLTRHICRKIAGQEGGCALYIFLGGHSP